MPKVTFVKSARKDNPVAKQGESYYWWKFAFGPKQFSKKPPRPSQLTQSDKLGRVYGLQERLEDFAYETPETVEDLNSLIESFASELREVAEEVREVSEEYQESCNNIRDNIPESPTADDCEEKAQELEGWADALEQAADSIEASEASGIEEVDEELVDEDAIEQAREEYLNAVTECFQQVEDEFTEACNCPI